ncbi:TetR family transcriptional regulator [Gordonia sp. FQ]|uniref:TetR family transcriptional regulator n=1 Tax=Gordonia sp. FQ TaxID=3446634 RepID=UPI003F8252C1
MTTEESGDSTRERIVAAASAEFARHGVSGARIDRIARHAKTSKERLYAYFRSKDELYAHVSRQALDELTAATRLDPLDLPGYAGRVFDYFAEHPDHLRLMRWLRLDQLEPQADPDDPFQRMILDAVGRIRAAQADGGLGTDFEAVDVLVLVNEIAVAWLWQPHVIDLVGDVDDPGPAARRRAAVEAVARIFPPAGTQTSDKK